MWHEGCSWLIKVLRPTHHRIRHFGDVLPSQSLGLLRHFQQCRYVITVLLNGLFVSFYRVIPTINIEFLVIWHITVIFTCTLPVTRRCWCGSCTCCTCRPAGSPVTVLRCDERSAVLWCGTFRRYTCMRVCVGGGVITTSSSPFGQCCTAAKWRRTTSSTYSANQQTTGTDSSLHAASSKRPPAPNRRLRSTSLPAPSSCILSGFPRQPSTEQLPWSVADGH